MRFRSPGARLGLRRRVTAGHHVGADDHTRLCGGRVLHGPRHRDRLGRNLHHQGLHRTDHEQARRSQRHRHRDREDPRRPAVHRIARRRPVRSVWRPRQDSNLRTWLRRPLLYPLSYEGEEAEGTNESFVGSPSQAPAPAAAVGKAATAAPLSYEGEEAEGTNESFVGSPSQAAAPAAAVGKAATAAPLSYEGSRGEGTSAQISSAVAQLSVAVEGREVRCEDGWRTACRPPSLRDP